MPTKRLSSPPNGEGLKQTGDTMEAIPNESQKPGITGGLANRSLTGGMWVIGAQGISLSLMMTRTIIAARFLSPSDFGLYGITSLINLFFDMFLATGLRSALIQKRSDVKGDLSTVWTLELIRGVFIFLFLIAAAPLLIRFFNGQDPVKGAQAIRVTAILFLIQGFSNIGVVLFERNMQFRKFFWMQIAGTAGEFVLTIVLALTLRNFWALLFGMLFGNLVRCIFSYTMIATRPAIQIDWQRARSLSRFGRWVLPSVVLGFLCSQGDFLTVGRMLDVDALGLYQMAATISSMPMTNISGIIGKVAFPAFSSIQDDLVRLRSAYLKTLRLILLIVIPVTVSIYTLAPEFVLVFLGIKWSGSESVISVLVFSGLLRPMLSLIDTVFNSIGKPKMGTGLQILRFASLLLFLIPFAMWKGVVGVAFAVLIGNLVPLIFFIRPLLRVLNMRIGEAMKPFSYAVPAGIAMGVVIISAKQLVRNDSATGFVTLAAVGWIFYCSLTWFLQRRMCMEIVNSIRGPQ